MTPGARDRIFVAALPLFAEHGVHATPPARIAAAAGLPEAEFAVHFPDREALANELYRHWKGAVAQAILGDFPVVASPREQFRVFWIRAADFANASPHATAWLRRSNRAPWLDDASRALEEQVHTLFVGFLERMRAERVVREESPELLAALVLGAFEGVFEASRRGRFPLTTENVSAAERSVWDAIRR